MRDPSKPPGCAYGCCPPLPPPGGWQGPPGDCCGPPGTPGEDGCDEGPPGFIAGLQGDLRLFTEEECEPTAQSCREPLPPPVAQLLKNEPRQDVVAFLERMLKWARAGELIGVVAFGNHIGRETVDGQAGDTDFAPIIAAFEDWKFRRVWRRNRTDEPEEL